MPIIIVASQPEDWPFDLPGIDVIDEWTYITSTRYSELRHTRVINLSRSLKYQSAGYYVSLLAEARGHKPLPSILTLQDLKSQSLVKLISEELDELFQKSLNPLHSDEFTLSIYFGRNMTTRYDRLCRQLFNLFPAPLLRVRFSKTKQKWNLRSVKALSGGEVPESHRSFVAEAAARHFASRSTPRPKTNRYRYDMAILWNPEEQENAPSNEQALSRFCKAAGKLGIFAELISRDDYGSLMEYDALFIRETTSMNDHTYRFSRKAANEGLVVIDDPQSIARCTNKVFLAELLQRNHIKVPKTVVLHRETLSSLEGALGFPCVLKKPDSSFSVGVVKVHSLDELKCQAAEFLGESELLVAQEFLPTEFDWRITLLDGKPLFACKYFMAPGHWQIIQQEKHGRGRYGKSETLPVELVPRKAIRLATKAAQLIGNGLYGVDVKQSAGEFYIIEVNDNPNIDSGVEDAVLRDELYEKIMQVFLTRIERQKSAYEVGA
ncbi:MAG: RimK family protein [Planctomycetaceae bacterium]|nr:RimK family protein [Planctomycetaceae bacterium]